MPQTVEAPLSAAQRSRVRRLSAPTEGAPSDEGGELNVVPYLDILMNILMFVLATISVVFVASVDTTAAPINGRIASTVPTLRMTVLITDQGYSVKTADGNLAAGCESLGVGLSVPKSGDGWDTEGLTACARRVKAAHPELAGDDHVTVSASPGIAYATVLGAMDALREDRAGKLFPEVAFGMVR
jgi:biopolymer transport protein ExbD